MERTQVLQIRISPDEKERITCNAELAGMKPAAYVRSMALHAKDERQTEAEENESFLKPVVEEGVVLTEDEEAVTVVTRPDKDFKLAVTRHVAQGKTKAHAERLAKEELDAQSPK